MMNISSIFPDVMITINMNVKAIMLHMMMETAAVINPFVAKLRAKSSSSLASKPSLAS